MVPTAKSKNCHHEHDVYSLDHNGATSARTMVLGYFGQFMDGGFCRLTALSCPSTSSSSTTLEAMILETRRFQNDARISINERFLGIVSLSSVLRADQ